MWRKTHRYLTLFLAIPLFCWIISGVLLNLIPSDLLSNRALYQPSTSAKLSTIPNIDLTAITAQLKNQGIGSINKLEILNRLDRFMIKASTKNSTHYYWIKPFQKVSLNTHQILELAQQSYKGKVNLSTPELLPAHLTRFQSDLNDKHAQYLIRTNDIEQTQIIIDAHSARVVTHLNRRSGVKDILMQLHFLDIDIDDGLQFNHWVIRITALLALLFAISGLQLLFPKIKKMVRHYT